MLEAPGVQDDLYIFTLGNQVDDNTIYPVGIKGDIDVQENEGVNYTQEKQNLGIWGNFWVQVIRNQKFEVEDIFEGANGAQKIVENMGTNGIKLNLMNTCKKMAQL